MSVVITRKLIRIGPILQVKPGTVLRMRLAYDTDMEKGSHWLNNAASEQLNADFPTIVAMAGLIENERDELRRKLRRIQRQLKKGQK